ncbi:FadR/GntR family transcriptional regulator [Microbacterium sp. RURRCA19A]|uniref:FadR/GntR family transcriptional regulator n=1 Tax=Microbacterium sp. RURRCA19A TaxID=1907391 RepID=UPI0009572578|nr:FCD domain-containing protein [Microbacterium sp. RURRCA19A]SIS07299.1 DNA-binding transcriptional regulator, FadR family [Microbacterium sp. RURRCA19A]
MSATEPAVGTLHDTLVARVGAAIVQGRLAAGSRLVTGELAEGSSRGAGREAVRVLESLGLVSVRRKAGVVVRPAADWNVFAPEIIEWRLAGPGRATQLRELSELRGAIEPRAARAAAREASQAQRESLVAAVMEMARTEGAADEAEYLAADVRFHRTLLSASGNAMFAALGDVVEAVLAGRTRHELMPHDANPHAVRWHQDVAFAIAAGRADEAATAMELIVREAGDAMASAASED